MRCKDSEQRLVMRKGQMLVYYEASWLFKAIPHQ
jgi:hypothetical protein